MSSGPKSWLSKLDQCIAINGGAAKLASSASSSDRAVIMLSDSLEQHIADYGDAGLPEDFGTSVPVGLPVWVPRSIAAINSTMPQRFKITSSTSTARKTALLQMKAESARAKEARLLAELESAAEAEDELTSRANPSVIDDEVQKLQDRLQMVGLIDKEVTTHVGDVAHAASKPEQPHDDLPS